MTEREKMLAGELYLATDPELTAARRRARLLFREFNLTAEDDTARRKALLQQLFGRAGERLWIEPPFYCDYGSHIYFGDGAFLNFNCVFLDCAEIRIGDNFAAGPGVQIYTAHHPLLASERIKGPELASPVHIGHNVWIGGGVVICPGVSIGDDTTIGAGSVVTKNIPSGVVAVGNPCRVLRQL
jgi:maltose O-acetyltransferase